MHFLLYNYFGTKMHVIIIFIRENENFFPSEFNYICIFLIDVKTTIVPYLHLMKTGHAWNQNRKWVALELKFTAPSLCALKWLDLIPWYISLRQKCGEKRYSELCCVDTLQLQRPECKLFKCAFETLHKGFSMKRLKQVIYGRALQCKRNAHFKFRVDNWRTIYST